MRFPERGGRADDTFKSKCDVETAAFFLHASDRCCTGSVQSQLSISTSGEHGPSMKLILAALGTASDNLAQRTKTLSNQITMCDLVALKHAHSR